MKSCYIYIYLLKVALSVDRYLSIRLINWSKTLFNSKRAALFCVLLIFIFFMLNLNINFTFGQFAKQNNTEIFGCYALDEAGNWMTIWSSVSIFFYRNLLLHIGFLIKIFNIYFKH